MAQLTHHSFGWVGHGFNPGVEHTWRIFGPAPPFASVVNATAHAVEVLGLERAIIAKDVRLIVLADRRRVFDVTVRNIGNTNIPSYNVAFSFVTS